MAPPGCESKCGLLRWPRSCSSSGHCQARVSDLHAGWVAQATKICKARGGDGSRKPQGMTRHLKNDFPRQQWKKNNCVTPSAWVGSAHVPRRGGHPHQSTLSMRQKEPSPPRECKSQGKLNTEIVIMRVCNFAQFRLNKAGSASRHFSYHQQGKQNVKWMCLWGRRGDDLGFLRDSWQY